MNDIPKVTPIEPGLLEMDISPRPGETPVKKPVVAFSLDDVLKHKFPVREPVLSPVFLLGSMNMIFARRGIGKTHVSLGIAYAAASGDAFFGWQASRPFKTLFIDGEMPGEALQERLAGIIKSHANTPQPDHLKIATIDLNSGLMPDLSTTSGQDEMEPLCKDAELIIVDNLSCLVRSGKENEAESWRLIAEWGLRLRSAGKCVIFIHHAGKNGEQRGTSKREDLLDVVLELKRPGNYNPEEGARFIVQYSKARHLIGEQAKPFEACLQSDQSGNSTWTTKPASESTYEQVVELSNLGMTQKEIADDLGINKSNVCRAYKKAVDEGLIDKKQRSKPRKNYRADLDG